MNSLSFDLSESFTRQEKRQIYESYHHIGIGYVFEKEIAGNFIESIESESESIESEMLDYCNQVESIDSSSDCTDQSYEL